MQCFKATQGLFLGHPMLTNGLCIAQNVAFFWSNSIKAFGCQNPWCSDMFFTLLRRFWWLYVGAFHPWACSPGYWLVCSISEAYSQSTPNNFNGLKRGAVACKVKVPLVQSRKIPWHHKNKTFGGHAGSHQAWVMFEMLHFCVMWFNNSLWMWGSLVFWK